MSIGQNLFQSYIVEVNKIIQIAKPDQQEGLCPETLYEYWAVTEI